MPGTSDTAVVSDTRVDGIWLVSWSIIAWCGSVIDGIIMLGDHSSGREVCWIGEYRLLLMICRGERECSLGLLLRVCGCK